MRKYETRKDQVIEISERLFNVSVFSVCMFSVRDFSVTVWCEIVLRILLVLDEVHIKRLKML